MEYDYDLVVIGIGPAGEKAAAQAAYFGKRVVAIERESHPGGAGTHTGTLPSKTLRETALYLSGYHSREMYGVAGELESDATLPSLMSRCAALAVSETLRIRHNLERHDVACLQGVASFVDAHTVQIAGRAATQRVRAGTSTVSPPAGGRRSLASPGLNGESRSGRSRGACPPARSPARR